MKKKIKFRKGKDEIKFRKGSGLMPSRPHKDKKKDTKELEDSLTEIGEREYDSEYYKEVEDAYREHTDIRQ